MGKAIGLTVAGLAVTWSSMTSSVQAQDCGGQGNATILVRTTGDLGASAKIRMGGRPDAPYRLMMDFGAGPADMPGVGTFCLDLGPNLHDLAVGHLNFLGLRAAFTTLPDDPGLVGQTIAIQLAVEDPTAPNGFAISNGFRTLLGVAGDPPPCAPCAEGCSPGFWKNHEEAWPEGYEPDALVSSFFTLPDCILDCDEMFQDVTLIQALDGDGGEGLCGGTEILLRAGVASLLNAAHPGVQFPRTVDEVIDLVNEALATCDRDIIVALGEKLEAENHGCPLEGDGSGVECASGILKLGFIYPLFYDGPLPADITLNVYETGNPGNSIGSVMFNFDPNNPPAFPITGGGLTVTDVTVHPGAVVVHATADATNFGPGHFPDSTTFEGTIGDVTHTVVIDTSCDTPIDVGSKFTPIFIIEIVVIE